MKYCEYCGRALDGTERVCPGCGSTIIKEISEEKINKTSENSNSKVSSNTEKPLLETDIFSTENAKTLSYVGFGCSIFFPIVGFIISIIALNKLKKHQITESKKFAIAGIIIGAIFTAIILISYLIGFFSEMQLWLEFFSSGWEYSGGGDEYASNTLSKLFYK